MLRRAALASTVIAVVVAPVVAVNGPVVAEEVGYYASKGDSNLDAGRYNLDLHWDAEDKVLTGTAEIRLSVFAAAPSITLDLHKRLEVASVEVDGAAAPFTHDGKDLVVTTPVVPGTPYFVTVAYSGKPRTVKAPTSRGDDDGLGWHTTDAGQVWTTQKPYGAYTWFPVNDRPSDKAFFDVRLSVPDTWTGVSNGRLVDKTVSKRETRTHFTNANPMAPHLLTVAIGPYKRYTQPGPHGLALTYWLPRGRADLLAPLEKTPETISWLESRLGPYPFDRAGIVVTPGLGSVESQTLMALAAENYKQGKEDVRQQVAHNLVHAWYGASVTPNDWRDNWMNEGVATFVEAKYSVAQHWRTWKYWKREFTRNDGYYREIYGPPGSYLPRQFGQRNVHYGGALLMERLRATIGTELFYTTLAEWPSLNPDRNRGRATYVDYLSGRAGRDLRPWFDAWLDSPTTPAG